MIYIILAKTILSSLYLKEEKKVESKLLSWLCYLPIYNENYSFFIGYIKNL